MPLLPPVIMAVCPVRFSELGGGRSLVANVDLRKTLANVVGGSSAEEDMVASASVFHPG